MDFSRCAFPRARIAPAFVFYRTGRRGVRAHCLYLYSKQTENLVAILSALLILAIGARVFGMYYMPHFSRLKRFLALSAFALAAAASVFVSYRGALAQREPENVSAKESARAWTPELQEKLLKEGKNVYVDFTASWCLTCQYNKQVLHSAAVEKLFRDNNIEILVGDWTNKNPLIT